MKKLLITLRHPGPADAICSVLPHLLKQYRIIFILTDSAIKFMKKKYFNYLDKVQVYIPSNTLNEGFINYSEEVKSCSCEFEGEQINELNILYSNLKQLVKTIQPDIALRTTPALKWGIDELLPRVMKELNQYDKLRCYQEYYGSGRAIKDNENLVANVGCKSFATVDDIAKNIKDYKEKDVKTIGWMNQGQFFGFKSYTDARNNFRKNNGIMNEFCILYCTIATNQIEKELQHFTYFLNAIKKSNNSSKVFCKFHPRNTKEEIEKYINVANNNKIKVEFLYNEQYDEILSFPDVLVSATSAVNIDCLEYQMLNLDNINTVCVYSDGELTKSFFLKAIEKETLPTHQNGSGNVIVNEVTYNNIFDEIQNNKVYYNYLYNEAEKLYKNDYNIVKNNFFNYLENIN
ncbi:MAG: hypothetical protein IKT41_00275 [Clostridia bacterium]|nr:hypothetical protein [Clostridia bacterium]